MSEPIFEVVQAGMQAAWQDLGRRHSFHHGVTEGGVMDIQAAMWANNLLDRGANEALIEITLGLFELVFKRQCRIALTGADLGASLDGKPVAPWRSYAVKDGARLKFTTPRNGLRAYLAVNAEFDLERHFDSVSTVAREKSGGLQGRNFQQGDIVIGIAHPKELLSRAVSRRYIPDYNQPLTLELIPGYQFERFPKASIDPLLSTEYQIQNSSNRMACTLNGEPITHEIKQLLSEGIAYGAVQIPPDGQPVILLNDRQTMGGYPKVGCISRLSGAALAQRFFPTSIRFKLQGAETARHQYIEHLAFFREASSISKPRER